MPRFFSRHTPTKSHSIQNSIKTTIFERSMDPLTTPVSKADSKHSAPRGNTVPLSRSRCWCFTLNNYTEEEKKLVKLEVSAPQVAKYIYGFEEGASGTKHIQGFIRFKNQATFSAVKKKIPRAHWEVAKGTDEQNYKYCSKEGDYETNMHGKVSRDILLEMVLASYENVTWKPWQSDVMDFLGCNCSRTIYWVFEKTGNVGKSFLCKYLACSTGTIICQGKAGDIFNQVNACIESGHFPKVVLCDIPRVSLEYVSYNALECLKNGLLYSGKYEGGKCIFPSPVVICFANEKPQHGKLSSDRLKVFEIKDELLFAKLP